MKVLKQKKTFWFVTIFLLSAHHWTVLISCLPQVSRYWRLIRTEKWKKISEHSPWCYACYAKYGSDMIGWEFEAIITYNLWFKNTWETMETFWEFGGNLVVLFYPDISNFTFWNVKIQNVKNVLIDFLDELGNFKQKFWNFEMSG